MEKILLVIIAICLFILIIQTQKYPKTEYFKDSAPQERFISSKKLVNLKQPFKIDYEFPKEKFSISNEKNYYLDIKKTKKYANIKETFKPHNINYNPMNSEKLYEKKNKN